MMSMIPGWAPNLHPLVIHFPIVLLILAVTVDLVNAIRERPAWLDGAATALYLAGAGAAVAAFLSGQQASAIVFIPGMAHPLVEDHRTWALVTVWYAGIVALARWAATRIGGPRARRHRMLLLVAGLIGAVLVQQTAERGARLVYEHGVGVIAAPGSR